MPTLEDNKQHWNDTANWLDAGNEWSAGYGTPAMQWYGSLLPRIQAFVPSGTILELAPGFGRWTHYLKDLCNRLIVVDLSPNCIERCRMRFASATHIEYHVNDGRSLAMVPDNTIDFLFTFDSFVHVERDLIEEYLNQILHKLTSDGVGFIHHSNLGAYLSYFKTIDKLIRGRRFLTRLGLIEYKEHGRARSMSADVFLTLAEKTGLKVVAQEIVNWDSHRPIDCISIVTKTGSKWDRDYRRLINTDFGREAAGIKRLANLYDSASFGNQGSRLTAAGERR